MIVLIQPMYSKQELNGDSNYVLYSALIRAMYAARPKWHFVVVFPDKESGFKYEPDGLFNLPNVTRVPQRIPPKKMSSAVNFDSGYYDLLYRRIGFDLVLCNLVESAANLVVAGEGSFEPKARPIVVAAHHYVIHDSLPYPFDRMANVAWAQIGGGLFADHNVFNSAHCRQMFIDTASKWLKPELIDSALKKSTLIPNGILEPELRPIMHSNPIPIIIYNHRLQGYKNYKETFAVLAELWGEGLRFKLRYTSSTAENISEISNYPFVEIKLCATRAEYLKALAEGDLNVTNSKHETFCNAAIESMAYGQPLIAPNGVTFPEITGAADNGYPYLFDSREAQKAMLRRLIKDKGERQKMGALVSAHVRLHYGVKLWADDYAALFERLTDFEIGSPADARKMVIKTMRDKSGAAINDLVAAVRSQKVGKRQPFSNQSLTLTKAVRLFRELGGRIVMEQGIQRVYYEG